MSTCISAAVTRSLWGDYLRIEVVLRGADGKPRRELFDRLTIREAIDVLDAYGVGPFDEQLLGGSAL